jgi:hypothetical protein
MKPNTLAGFMMPMSVFSKEECVTSQYKDDEGYSNYPQVDIAT